MGQTIVVKEVDENGKPTAWESADYQPRTHWTESVEIMPETTVEIDPDSGNGQVYTDFALEPDKPYTIKYNGVEYADCVGMTLDDGGLYFGNLGAALEGAPVTEHPFILAFAAMDMDEDGNVDYMMVVIPLDGAETVTLSIAGEVVHTIPQKYIDLPYYVYDIPYESFERHDIGTRTYYEAYVSEVPVSLLEAMYLGKPIYLRITETISDAKKPYMAPAQWGCYGIDFLWLSIDKTLETIPSSEVELYDVRISAHVSYSYHSFMECFVRFTELSVD